MPKPLLFGSLAPLPFGILAVCRVQHILFGSFDVCCIAALLFFLY